MNYETHIERIVDEENDEFSNDDLFNISSWGADPSVRELILQYKDGDIEKPELQRKYVWTKKEASRFIESLLLGLPVPSIFLANMEPSGKRLIIDGYQRIRTLYDYIEEGIWHGDDTEFKLINSELINKRWRGKSFNDLLADDKRRLRTYTIHAIIFEQKHPSDDSGLFQVFERINTSGTSLNNQEIRNCVYQGAMNKLLFSLNRNKEWRILFGGSCEDNRMIDLEFILRFFAMNDECVYKSDSKQISLKQLLNKYMQSNQVLTEKEIGFKTSTFNETISFIINSYGEEAFFNLQKDFSKIRRKFHPAVYDSIMIATSIALSRGYTNCKSADLKLRRMNLLYDDAYRESIMQATMQVENIYTRISRALYVLYDMEL
ncbi:MAG: DUF262 domain-containing protein [Bacteroides sp.]|nr:DUF262 domain-containing protein [Bacteroides sp.]MCM1085059.1 DUF262 domain-containing protein [Bacteroides sp.]